MDQIKTQVEIPAWRPVIWPNSKKQAQPISEAELKAMVKMAAQTRTEKAVEQAQQAAHLKNQLESLSRQNMTWLKDQLQSLGIKTTSANLELASALLSHGLKLSKENFVPLLIMLASAKGGISKEAAILALKKGITEPAAAKALETSLNGSQMAQQLNSTHQALMNLQALLNTSPNLLSPTLTAQLSGLLAGFVDFVENKYKNFETSSLTGQDLIENSSALKALISGIEEKLLPKDAEGIETLSSALKTARENLNSLTENLLAQAILSRPVDNSDYLISKEKYAYWQIPYSANPPRNMELVIQRDTSLPNAAINPTKTKIVMKLETKNIGEVAVEMVVNGRDIDFKFNTESDEIRKLVSSNQEDLKKRLEVSSFKAKNLQVVKNKIKILRYLAPAIDLKKLNLITAEA